MVEFKDNDLLKQYIPEKYFHHALQNTQKQQNLINSILTNKQLPKEGLDETTIKSLLCHIASMDSNNFSKGCGMGEREGRVFSNLVKQRHFGFAHGIGRSGDVAAPQPKAVGSSLIYSLLNKIVNNFIKKDIPEIQSSLVLPFATGMALTFSLISLKTLKSNRGKNKIIWPRIDQKTCFKSIITAGLIPIVIENKKIGNSIVTDLEAIENAIEKEGAETILAVISTTSCFAPRSPDSVENIAAICKKFDVAHVVNNAYGFQCLLTCMAISSSCRKGRVDAIVMSTDKNFMVPVGGAIVSSPSIIFVKNLSEVYPGRASFSPILDLFITLLSMGENGYNNLRFERKKLFNYLEEKLRIVTEKHSENLLKIEKNNISIAISLYNLDKNGFDISLVGAKLFQSFCFGSRVVKKDQIKTLAGYLFKGYGAHFDNYGVAYLACAVGLGATQQDIDRFIKRLNRALNKK